MNNRRLTPQSKGPPSASKFVTPPNLNVTYFDRRSTSKKPFRTGSAFKPMRSQTCLDITGIGNQSNVCPTIKSNLTGAPIPHVDYDLDCDCIYSDYLEVFMKEEIFMDVSDRHEQDMKDQLAIQKDHLYRNKMMLHKVNEEMLGLERLEQVDEVIKSVQNNFDSFLQLNDDFDLSTTLEQLLLIFDLSCNKVSVKNVNTIDEQDSFDKLQALLQKCGEICAKMKSSERNIETVSHLAGMMRKYQGLLDCINQKQEFITNAQINETYKLLKFISDMYAIREKYSTRN